MTTAVQLAIVTRLLQVIRDRRIVLEEVPVKWMDRPSATEKERGCASEMDGKKKCHNNENATEMVKI